MFGRFFGQRNPEKDIERILVDLRGTGTIGGGGLFGSAIGGYNTTDTSVIVHQVWGITLPDNKDARAYGLWEVPTNFLTGTVTFDIAVRSTVGGNLYCYLEISALRCGSTNFEQCYDAIEAITLTHPSPGNDAMFCIKSCTLDNLQVGDIVIFVFRRDATNAADTVSSGVQCIGMHASF